MQLGENHLEQRVSVEFPLIMRSMIQEHKYALYLSIEASYFWCPETLKYHHHHHHHLFSPLLYISLSSIEMNEVEVLK